MIKRASLFLCILLGLFYVQAEGVVLQDLRGELAVGSWYGRAIPADPANAPFPEVVMTPTFLADGTMIANDSHELTNPHASAHGHWVRTGANKVHAVFIWMNVTNQVPNGFAGAFKIRLWGEIDPANPDRMIGKVAPVVFPPGTNPMDVNDAGGIPAGVFNIVELKRIKADKAVPIPGDLSKELSVGSWYGRAVPANPANAPFPEVVMTPSFLADGNVIANDSHEATNPHAMAHGNWVKTGTNQIQATFIWMNLTAATPNGFAGAFKIRLKGQVDPANPDVMTGQVEPVVFPPGTDPMDANDRGGIPAGVFNIVDLKRVKADKAIPVVADLSKELSMGSWYGRAVPANPANAPFPEVVMTPTFLGDGNIIANDSHELTNPHVTAHGQWVKTGTNQIQATFVWLNITADTPNGFAGAFKIRLKGQVDPANPNTMTGQVEPFVFPPGTDVLDPNDKGGISGGIFNIVELKRIDANPQGARVQEASVVATVIQNGAPVAGANVAFARSVAGSEANFLWKATTDASGKATLKITQDQKRPTGYYLARATTAAGSVIGTWSSIPINGGDQVQVTLPVGGKAEVVSALSLEFVSPLMSLSNSPNPFNPATQIVYALSDNRDVRLVIFNHLGQEVRELVHEFQPAGSYRIVWDGKDATGRLVASGLYIYRLSSGGFSQTRQMLLLK